MKFSTDHITEDGSKVPEIVREKEFNRRDLRDPLLPIDHRKTFVGEKQCELYVGKLITFSNSKGAKHQCTNDTGIVSAELTNLFDHSVLGNQEYSPLLYQRDSA